MEKRSEGVPPDLIAAIILALVTLVFTFPPENDLTARIPLSLLIVLITVLLFLPGYMLTSALFPKIGDLLGIKRIALSFGLGIAVVPLICLALNATPWGIQLTPVVISLAIFTLCMAPVAYWRIKVLPAEERFTIRFYEKIGALKTKILADEKKRLDKALTVILILVIIISIAAVVYVIVIPKQGEKFTEFYILGAGGKAYGYPTSVQAGNKSTLIVGVANHEYRVVNYTMHISLNNTSMDNSMNDTLLNGTLLNGTLLQVIPRNLSSREEVSPEDKSQFSYTILSMNLTLQNNETWERPVTYILNSTGDQQKLEFLLYREDNFTKSYRDLHLWVNVTKSVSFSPGNATILTAAQDIEREIK